MPAAPNRRSARASRRTTHLAEALLMPRLGAHMSVAGGLHHAFGHARAAGCQCLQVFVKNQRQWRARPYRPDEVAAWHAAAAAGDVRPVIAHATYLINLASPDEGNWRRSIDAFADELERCEQLGIDALVVHPGAHLGAGEAAGCRRAAEGLRHALDRLGPARVRPSIELTAGQGTCLGHRFEHVRDILDALAGEPRVGVCFDTCHVLAAGFRFDTDETYAATFAALDAAFGRERLLCFHLNDSAGACGSRVDRHAHIGTGHVGRGAFRRIVRDPRWRNLPMILETPKGVDQRGRDHDRLNLARLRRMIAAG